MNRIHFISSLPRPGSALLRKPRFRASMSGPLAGLFGSLRGEMNGRSEFNVFIDDAQQRQPARRQLERVAGDLGRPAPTRHAVDIRTA